MGNKADVIKGFSKRCNEHWDVAPRSEIGLYLGDIQDHIVTMVANLVHVEKILSRGHSNYLAQISIKSKWFRFARLRLGRIAHVYFFKYSE